MNRRFNSSRGAGRRRAGLLALLAIFWLAQLQGVAPRFVASLLKSFSGNAPADAPAPAEFDEPLTSTQLKVISLLANGLTNQEIADNLAITVGTVKWHIHQIFSKLDVRNRTEAVALARRAGILRLQ